MPLATYTSTDATERVRLSSWPIIDYTVVYILLLQHSPHGQAGKSCIFLEQPLRVCINQGFSKDFPEPPAACIVLPVALSGKHFPDEATAIGQEIGIVVFAYGRVVRNFPFILKVARQTYKLSVGIEKQYIQIIDDVFVRSG